MKKGFTLIELLVVIAIIAILAAILFPVFAQAKLAAKKATSISNQKQISLGILMYSGDADDMYPHNDDCVLNSALDPKWNNQTVGFNQSRWCNDFTDPGGFAFRTNHYAWEKWVMPYVKSVPLFLHPSFSLIKGTATDANHVPTLLDQGEIANGYALNIAITGSQNTWNCPHDASGACTNLGAYRNSFVGGTQTGIPSPAEAMITIEQWFHVVTGGYEIPSNNATTTYYPAAMREKWENAFLKTGGSGYCGNQIGVVDPTKVPFGVVPVGFADGHVKAMNPNDILGKSPSMDQYGVPHSTNYCYPTAAYFSSSLNSKPAYQGSWPFWGLQ
jgi:prepilin-type N-terminal cleavage/methylation domain-containing protein/prepilin-type processing-associated H-X9-DG protein